MRVYPASGPAKVGFDVVQDAVRDALRSDAACEILDEWSPEADTDRLNAELRRIEELVAGMESDERVPFSAIPDAMEAIRRSAPEGAMLSLEDLLDVAQVIRVARQVRSWFESRGARYAAIRETVLGIEVPADLATAIGTAIGDDGQVSDAASPELRRIRRALMTARNRVREAAQRALRDASAAGYATEDQPTIRGGRVVIPVRAEAKRKVQGFVHDVSASGQTVYIEPAAALEYNNEVRELEIAEAHELERIRRALTDGVRSARTELADAVRRLLALDVRLAKASVCYRIGATRPEVHDDGVIDIRDARNAALMLHMMNDGSGRSVVPMDVALNDQQRIMVISGPNAGGKSVAMKALGLFATMLSHGLLLPVAPGSRFDLFHALMVDIGDEQSMEDDLSTFSSHLTNLRHIVEQADRNTLVLIDEAGTGTDPEAGGAMARAVLEQLADRGARTVVTTHFGPLKVYAHEAEGVVNASMLFDEERLEPSYRLQTGLPGSSFASEIAQRVGLPGVVIERAREILGDSTLRADSLIADLVSKNRSLDERVGQAERALEDAQAKQARLDTRLATLAAEGDAIRQKALHEAESIVKGANRAVERTIREIRESQAAREQTERARERLGRTKEHIESRARKVDARAKGPSAKGQPATGKKPKSTPKKVSEGHGSGLSVGDQVRVDTGDAVGEVVEISRKDVLVALGSMQLRVASDRLTKVGGPKEQQVRVSHSLQSDGALSIQQVSQRLDIRGHRVDEAVSKLMPFLDRAIGAGLDRVDILHGKGTGALRQVVADYLDSTPQVVRHGEAPIEEGGAGITIVHLA